MHPEELEGRHLVDFDTVTPRTEIVAAFERIVSGERIRTEITHARRDGAHVDVEMHASAFEVGGHRYLLAFDRDVTSRKRAEAERKLMEVKLQETQKLESLGLLAGGIAHDFNNLLTGILGNANLARGEDAHPRDRAVPRSDRAFGRARRRPVRADARLRRQGALRGAAGRSEHRGRRHDGR